LQGIAAEISFGGQIRKTVRQAQLIRRHRQLPNLGRKLFGLARPYVVWQFAKPTDLVRDGLLLVGPDDLLSLSA
jgi:hypothetical protein